MANDVMVKAVKSVWTQWYQAWREGKTNQPWEEWVGARLQEAMEALYESCYNDTADCPRKRKAMQAFLDAFTG
jgi:hypothetical protein